MNKTNLPITVNGKARKCWPMPGGAFQIEAPEVHAVVSVRPPAKCYNGNWLVVGPPRSTAERAWREQHATLPSARAAAGRMLAAVIERRTAEGVAAATGVAL